MEKPSRKKTIVSFIILVIFVIGIGFGIWWYLARYTQSSSYENFTKWNKKTDKTEEKEESQSCSEPTVDDETKAQIKSLIDSYITYLGTSSGDYTQLKTILTERYQAYIDEGMWGHGGMLVSCSGVSVTRSPDCSYRALAAVIIGSESGGESPGNINFLVKEEDGKLLIDNDSWIGDMQ